MATSLISTSANADEASAANEFTVAASDGGAARVQGNGTATCQSGRVCVYSEYWWYGRGASFEYTFHAWSHLRSEVAWISNRGRSGHNNGNSMNVCLYEYNNHNGHYYYLVRGLGESAFSNGNPPLHDRLSSNRWVSGGSGNC
ncbi:peptidase inhibitor family I36 protein [Natronoglycomyces albus]|uniref:Peptidase inhibitor family I36 protein n=1 Tax=Natronoglycomyces albus TaxID=2811108 RepID=A0A895XPH1_9ACTN|nr:peptidase inhibitor family I36 protein [Natronoglycomyces albus]